MRNLQSILNDIEQGLLAASPKFAFELVDKFLATADGAMIRVDDSSGETGQTYLDAVILWLNAVKAWDDPKTDWFERVYDLNRKNDFAIFDSLLPNSHVLLDTQQLKQLADRYEEECHLALITNGTAEQLNMDGINARIALGCIAEALQDPQV